MTDRTPAEALAEACYPASWDISTKAEKATVLQMMEERIRRLNSLGFDVTPIGDGK